jgi:hypothetical protein
MAMGDEEALSPPEAAGDPLGTAAPVPSAHPDGPRAARAVGGPSAAERLAATADARRPRPAGGAHESRLHMPAHRAVNREATKDGENEAPGCGALDRRLSSQLEQHRCRFVTRRRDGHRSPHLGWATMCATSGEMFLAGVVLRCAAPDGPDPPLHQVRALSGAGWPVPPPESNSGAAPAEEAEVDHRARSRGGSR